MLAVVFTARLAMGVQFQAIPVVAPLLATDLHLSYTEIGLLTGLFMLPGIVVALPAGALGARFGDRRIATAALLLMVAGAVGTAASTTFALAAATRVVSGAGGVLLSMALAKMTADWFAGAEMSGAMAVMLTSWPVGLGLALVGVAPLAAATSWRGGVLGAAAVPAFGLVLLHSIYRDPSAVTVGRARVRLGRRDVALALGGGLAWACFNASLLVILAFAPGFLLGRGASIASAAVTVSIAVWVTIASVPAGGWLADRTGRGDALILTGCVAAALATAMLVVAPHPVLWLLAIGIAVGLPAGPIMSLVPRAVAPEHLATAFAAYYAIYYVVMTAAQPAAGLARDVTGSATAPLVLGAIVMGMTLAPLAWFLRLERSEQAVA